MFDTFVRVLILALLIGVPMYVSRLIILRKEITTKVLVLQSIVLLLYISVMFLLQAYDLNNESIYLTNAIVVFWLGFYLVLEPVIAYLVLFKEDKLIKTRLIDYVTYSVVSSFIVSVIGVVIVALYAVSNGLSA